MTRYLVRLVSRAAIAAVFAAVFAAAVHPVIAQVPSPGELLARHEAALGGRAALEKYSSLRLTGVVELDGGALKGTIEILRAKPDKFVQKMTLERVGDFWKGYDGTTAWELELSTPSLLTDVDAAAVRNYAQWDYEFLAPVALYVGRVDSAEFEGEPVWQVTFASDLGLEVQSFFSRATGLRTGVVTNAPSGVSTAVYGDYTEVGGVRVPRRRVTRSDSSGVVVRIEKIEWDKVPAAAFELPPPVKAIAKDQAGSVVVRPAPRLFAIGALALRVQSPLVGGTRTLARAARLR